MLQTLNGSRSSACTRAKHASWPSPLRRSGLQSACSRSGALSPMRHLRAWPGSVRLPLAIVAGHYSLQRPAFGAVLECIEVLRGTHQTLPAGCVVLASTADRDGHEPPAIEPREPDRVLRANVPRRSVGGVARRSATLATAAARLGNADLGSGTGKRLRRSVTHQLGRLASAIYVGAPAELP
jgi:hypothetical protein